MIRRSLLSFGVLVACASAAGAQARTVTITASDFRFDAPDSIPAGLTTFNLVGVGPELHHMQILRLEQGKTAKACLRESHRRSFETQSFRSHVIKIWAQLRPSPGSLREPTSPRRRVLQNCFSAEVRTVGAVL